MTKMLTVEQALALAEILSAKPQACYDVKAQSETGDGRVVIVRSRDAGVLYGDYAGREGANIHLKNAVQMWSWRAAKGGTLADCATYGVKPSDCKFSIGEASVTVLNACALIDCSSKGAASLRKVEGGKWS